MSQPWRKSQLQEFLGKYPDAIEYFVSDRDYVVKNVIPDTFLVNGIFWYTTQRQQFADGNKNRIVATIPPIWQVYVSPDAQLIFLDILSRYKRSH